MSPSIALHIGGATNFSLGGDATVVHPGNGSPTAAELSATGPNGESHVNLAIPKDLKLRQLTSLSTDYKFVVGSCWAGSPRFTANVRNGNQTRSVFFYIGTPPNSGACPQGAYANTGNLAAPGGIVDARQLGRSSSESYSSIQAAFGDLPVTAVHIDVDGGEAGDQTVDFDNTVVNGKLVTYEPQHGISVLVQRTAGSIRVKQPGKRGRKKGFTSFKKVESVLVNSIVDTRGGKIEVTAATGNFGDTTPDQSVSFYQGLIQLTQRHGHNARATAKLVGKLNCPGRARGARAGKASEPIATTSRRRRRSVWGSGHGSYGTAGSGGTGSVRGTTWLTRDNCNGTLFRVTEGVGIVVHDNGLDKNIFLGPGQSYFAKNP